MAVLERSIQLPITADIFLTRAQERARLTGASFEEAIQSLIVSLTTRDLECVGEEFMQRSFGNNTEAREAFKRKITTDTLSEEAFVDQS